MKYYLKPIIIYSFFLLLDVADNHRKSRDAFKEIMKNEKQVLKMLFAKIIFLGPPERGKTLTRLRLENKWINMKSDDKYQNNPSTNIAETDMFLISDLSEMVALVSEKGWKTLKEQSEEVQLLFQLFFKLREEVQPIQEQSNEASLPIEMSDEHASGYIKTEISEAANLSTDTPSLPSESMTKFLKYFDKCEASGKWEELTGKLENLCLLYMKDTGGQPEFMDMLPALIIGPALYFIFCRYGDNLDKTYRVALRGVHNSQIPEKMSSCTVRQSITSALSSIYSMKHYSTRRATDCTNALLDDLCKNMPDTLAYFIGTHKDEVTSQEMIDFDRKMQDFIKDTLFYEQELVRFVSQNGFESKDPKDKMPEGMERLIYPIDNNSGTEEEIEGLQKFIKKALNEFPRHEIPARWLPFSLLLRLTEKKYIDLKVCYQYGESLRMDENETNVALWFFHHNTGIIYHFPNVPHLENIVITDTQLMFDSISHLIFENGISLRQGAGDKLRKVGQISFADIKKVSGKMLQPQQMEALLKHFHIIAPLHESFVKKKYIDDDTSQLYFMPCVLPNCSNEELVSKTQNICSKGKVHAMKICFPSGFTPIGLFPSAIASLVGQTSQVTSCSLRRQFA